MTTKIKNSDFIELDYTGTLADGVVFDTTHEAVAKEHHLFSKKKEYHPAIICVGEKQLLPGLDAQLEGRDVGESFTVSLAADQAFGKRDITKMKIVPVSTFKEHNVQPQPGLQVDMDGERGIITRISGGRIIVNFNHPLAGKEVTYTVKIHRKVTENTEKITAFLASMFGMPKDSITVTVANEKAKVVLPVELPAQIVAVIGDKLKLVTGLKEIVIEKASSTKESKKEVSPQ
ncbi:MAG: peptidylprolyl isomerase [Nanoarchaeota archaeon]|nr:peptidylprolyl isomerase [Nanoarchaeota archaeon]